MDIKLVESSLVNSRTGIIKSLDKCIPLAGTFPMKTYAVNGNPVIDENCEVIINSIYGGMGFSFETEEEAKIGAIGEFVERYSSAIVNAPVIEGSFNSLNEVCIDPLQITRVSPHQFMLNNIDRADIDRDSVFYWVQGYDETNKCEKWIPTELVYLTAYFKSEIPIRDMISTGLATGNSILDAKERGLLECIERDAITIMWYRKMSMPKIKLDSIKDKEVSKIIKNLKELDLEIVILDIRNNIDIPTYLVVLKSEVSPYLSVGGAAHYEPIIAIKGAFKEAIAVYNFSIEDLFYERVKSEDEYLKLNGMDDHSSYYAFYNRNDKLAFLENGREIEFEQSKKGIVNYQDLISDLKNKNIDVLTVDLTTSDVKSLGLYVVRTVVPKFAFLELVFPMDVCERLENVPKELGYTTECELNSLMHPFP